MHTCVNSILKKLENTDNTLETTELFPLSKTKKIRGNRHLAREKVMQVLAVYEVCQEPIDFLFSHIFVREFKFEEEELSADKLLTPAEIIEHESDIPIVWKKDEVEFAKQLVRCCVKEKPLATELMLKYAKNWELNRIAIVDRVLILMGISELIHFETIPPKVTMNEIIEISKEFSADKSITFLNAVLDASYSELKKRGLINKAGKGLKLKK